MTHHVLHILGTARAEGAGIARIVSALAAGLDPARYHVHAWFLGGEGPLAAEVAATGTTVRVIKWRRGVRDPLGALRFRRALSGCPCTIVHQHFGARSPRWLLRTATRAPLVVHLHGLTPGPYKPWRQRALVAGAEKVIATSRAVAEQFPFARPEVVYPAAPVSTLNPRNLAAPSPRRSAVIGTACRLDPVKGLTHLIRAFAATHSEFPELRLEIAGEGPERGPLEAQARALGLAGCINFLGWQDDLAPVLSRWQIFVLPSLEEGFGIAALEAMAAGLPVVATAAGGLPELVEHGRTGWLVPPGDSAALANRLRELVADPELGARMGAAAVVRARGCFSANRLAAAVSGIYDALL